MVNLVVKENVVIKYKCSIVICDYPVLLISVENSMLTNTKNYGAKILPSCNVCQPHSTRTCDSYN